MKYISNILGFLAVFCVFGVADAALRAGGVNTNAATSRVSSIPVNGTTGASRRLPTMILPQNVTSSSGSTSSDSSLMDVTECVDAYTECIKGPDVCGANFEECTTAELFYAKKPQCNGVLLQCSSAGINTLFGTTNTAYLSVEYMETYPTSGSIVGQFIAAGEINNRLDKSACVKRYVSCLKKDDVCGDDFELCTSTNEFKKQMIYCESTLARCTDEGKTELFGTTNTSGANAPMDGSRLRIMITEGAALASRNAVSTCYRVADQCILSACSANPYKCIIDSSSELICANDTVNGVACTPLSGNNLSNYVVNAADVRKYLKSSCMNTIGGNKYCYMTFKDGAIPTASDLIDEDTMEEVYSAIYSLRMNDTLRTEIENMANEVDRTTKDKCIETIKSCVMRSCGGGVGSACYAQVFGANGNAHLWINQDSDTYDEIQSGCAAIVNTDPACQYAAASVKTYGANASNIYGYTYKTSDSFTTLFPKCTGNDACKDPIGVVEKLSSLLKANYSPAAIEKLAKQCKKTVESCIRNNCGADYSKCFRNRSDILSDTYSVSSNTGSTGGSGFPRSGNTGPRSGNTSPRTSSWNTSFENSMNRVGGVLDFTIIRGLCGSVVSESKACEEHLRIQTVKNQSTGGGTGGGTGDGTGDGTGGGTGGGWSNPKPQPSGTKPENGAADK